MWLQFSIVTDINNLGRTEEALSEAGAISITLINADRDAIPSISVDKTVQWPKIRVIGLFEAQTDMAGVRDIISAMLGHDALSGSIIEPLEDRDWSRAWMDYFKPMQFGKRLWVCPGTHAPPDPSAINIMLDPGQAFGTGTHPTTALCLEWLEGTNIEGLDVIDYGCGSGILAIAAAKLGARHVWAVDNDPQALLTTQENVQKNDVSNNVSIVQYPLSSSCLNNSKVDIVVANILSGPLISLASHLANLVHQGGTIILSGILKEQSKDVVPAYAPWFDITSSTSRDSWVRLEGRRKTKG